MQVNVQLSAGLARSMLQHDHSTEAATQLASILDEFQVQLMPVYPGTQDPSLMGYFTIMVQDDPTAQRLIQRLVSSGVVQAAYAQPLYGLP